MTKLQDAVPPFSAQLGRKVIESELGIKIEDVFSSLSLEPVASASIGQVYKGTLRSSGQEVAVKVQRPQVLQNVALDLHLMRSLAPKWQEYKEMNTNLVGLVDAWGSGFINELDYRKEAQATTEFSEAMKERGLGSVFAPEVVPELSSIHVLTTKWVDGERLIDSDSEDVPRLCGVALNAYLTMMLDTGKLHCDPHPGNLLRESSTGRLCILDWGMTLDVPSDLQLSLLEFIANLNSDNYEDIPQDLVKLKFVPEDKLDELRQSGLTVAIRNILKLAAEGGGPKGAMQRMVAQNKEKYAEALKGFDDLDSPEATAERQRLFREDWQRQMAEDALSRSESDNPQSSTTMDLTTKIEQLQEANSDVFAIPDYFVYMSRAFATLEGIGLTSDSNYSITKECFPYLAKRLISDDSPRARGALKMLLYGRKNVLDLTKLQEITYGFESYTTSTSSVESGRGMSNEGRNTAIEQIANVLLDEDSNYVQELLLRESAMALDTTIRNRLLSPFEHVRSLPLLQFSSSLPQPLSLPLELAKMTIDLQELDEKDHKRLDNVKILSDLLNSGDNNRIESIDGSSINGRKIIQEAFERRQALTRIGLRFGGSLVNVQAERLRERSETSELAKLFALRGADTCDTVAKIIADLDSNLSGTR